MILPPGLFFGNPSGRHTGILGTLYSFLPHILRNAGSPSKNKAAAAADGLPERPNKSLPSFTAARVAIPGFILTCQKSTSAPIPSIEERARS